MDITMDRIIEIAEALGWQVYDYHPRSDIEFSKQSSFGETVCFQICGETLQSAIEDGREQVDTFDLEEYCQMWLKEMRRDASVPRHIQDLVHAGEENRDMCGKLISALESGEIPEQENEVVATVHRNGLEICEVLTVSTAHIKKTTANELDAAANTEQSGNVDFPVYSKADVGWFIYITGDETDLPDLKLLVQLARKHHCDIICIDADGPTIPGLPTYDW